MVKLIFKDGEKYVDPNVGLQPPMFERFRDVMNGALASLGCPNHGASSYATLMVNVDYDDSNWEIMDFCCTDFSRIVEAEMPFPWSRARRHQKS